MLSKALALTTLMGLAGPGAAVPAPTMAQQDMPTDAQISDAVDRELLLDAAVWSHRVDVSTADGVVTMSGSAGNLLSKQRAARIAETVKGVRSVVNLIEISPPEDRSDQEVRRDVRQALMKDPATDSYELSAAVDDGHVVISGNVESWTEKQLTDKVVAGVNGVTGTTNEVEVTYEADRPDEEILNEVEAALEWNALVDHALIDVSVQDGRVTLTGTVGSAAEKRQARYDAWTAGVAAVDDSGIEVARWARDEDLRKTKYVAKPKDEMKAAVEDALVQDPRVYSFNVETDVSGSVVTLRGVVDNLKAKRAAEQVAEDTVGVSLVYNYIKVRPVEDRADEAIEEDVRDAFLRDPFVDRYELSVEVDDGIAYLTGAVDSYFEKGQADDLVSRVNGVSDVINNIEVEDDPYAYDPYVDDWYMYDYDWYHYTPSYTFKQDWEIKEEINDEYFWSPFVDAADVTVKVDDGVATLTGTVDSWMEWGAARDNAYEAGATFVRNKLTVEGAGAMEASSSGG